MESKYGLTLLKERDNWDKNYLYKWIKLPLKCPNCGNNIIHTNLNNSICNPYVGRYNRKTSRKIIYLRKNTFFNFFPHIPVTIILEVLYQSICNNSNANIIFSKIENKYNIKSIRYQTILKILEKLGEAICHYFLIYIKFNLFQQKMRMNILLLMKVHLHHFQINKYGL